MAHGAVYFPPLYIVAMVVGLSWEVTFSIVRRVGEITMANELLCAKIGKLEAGRPLVGRMSRQ